MTSAKLNEYSVECPLPSPERTSPRRLQPALRNLALVAFFTAIVMLLQGLAGCFTTELSGYPDEPAHLITGLMIRDYVVSGVKASPLHFAREYYLHYPKVGFGIWPPLFHFVEGSWFLVVPPSKISAFALQALIIGVLASLLAGLTAQFYGWMSGIVTGLVFVTLPTTQVFSGMIMADGLMALFAFAAMLSLAAWLASRRLRDAIFVGVCIGLALMTKSNAAALALLPPLGLLLMRQYRRIFSWHMILAGIVAIVIALPWQVLMLKLWTSTVSTTQYSPSIALHQLILHFQFYFHACGVVVLALSMIGFIQKVVLPYIKGTIEPKWAAAAALPVALFLFAFAPLPAEPRYHIASYAAICLFATAGFVSLADAVSSRWHASWVRPALAVMTVALYAATTLTIPQRASFGYPSLATDLLSNPKYARGVILVSSDNFGEGMLITEVALREPRPGHYVLRATKVLSKSRWDLDSYQLLWKTPAEIMTFLESIPVRVLVLDNTPGPVQTPHHQLLKQMLALYPDKWSHVNTYPKGGTNQAGGHLELYEYTGTVADSGTIQFDVPSTIDNILR